MFFARLPLPQTPDGTVFQSSRMEFRAVCLSLLTFLLSISLSLVLVLGSDDDHHRVRRFIFTKNSKVSFDFNFLRPVPIMGQMDVMGIVEVPVSVIMDNDTFNW